MSLTNFKRNKAKKRDEQLYFATISFVANVKGSHQKSTQNSNLSKLSRHNEQKEEKEKNNAYILAI